MKYKSPKMAQIADYTHPLGIELKQKAVAGYAVFIHFLSSAAGVQSVPFMLLYVVFALAFDTAIIRSFTNAAALELAPYVF